MSSIGSKSSSSVKPFSLADAEQLGRQAVAKANRRQARLEKQALAEMRPEFNRVLSEGRKVLVTAAASPKPYIGVDFTTWHWTPVQVGAFIALARQTFPGFTIATRGLHGRASVVSVSGTRELLPPDCKV